MEEFTQTKAIIWSAVERFASQGIQFIIGVIIARLLDPSCYGLIAMLYIFLAVGQSLIDSGFGSALIQKKVCTDKDYSTVFYFNIFISLLLYLILCLCSPLIAKFYQQPELENVVKVSTIVFVLNAFAIVQRAQLTKKMDFRSQSVATIISVLFSGLLGIFLAYNNFGVWALVILSLFNSGINTIMLWKYSHWRPSLCFSTSSFKELYGFGSRMMLTGLITTIYNNLYTLVIGKFYSPKELGYYNRMQQIATFPSKNLTSVIARAVYPKQCKIQDDKVALFSSYLKLLSHSSFIVFPLMFGLAALSEPLVKVLLGTKWVLAAPYLSILCFAYCFDHIQYFNWQILSVKGRSDLSLNSEIIKKIISIVILIITIPMGIKVMLWGLAIYALFDIIIIIPFVHKVMPEITYGVEFKAIVKQFALALLMFLGIKAILPFFSNEYVQLLCCGILGCAVYLIASQVLHLDSWLYFKNTCINKFKKTNK